MAFKKVVSASYVGLVLGSVGCGGTTPVATATLVGAFKSNCYVTGGGGYAVTTLTQTDTTFKLDSLYYAASDTTCAGTSTAAEHSTGTYALGTTTAAGATGAIDFAFTASTTQYDIYSLSGSTLKLGDRSAPATDGSTVAKRPTTLSTTITYTKL